jgi:hypothetical protein
VEGRGEKSARCCVREGPAGRTSNTDVLEETSSSESSLRGGKAESVCGGEESQRHSRRKVKLKEDEQEHSPTPASPRAPARKLKIGTGGSVREMGARREGSEEGGERREVSASPGVQG